MPALEIDQIMINYREINPEGNPLIIFVHGNSGSSRTFLDLMGQFNDCTYRMIAVDLPGHGSSGRSSLPEGYSPAAAGDFLLKFVKTIHKTGPLILIGFSYGTNVIAEAIQAGLHPDGVVFLSSSITGKGFELPKIFSHTEEPSIFSYNETDAGMARSFLVKQAAVREKKQLEEVLADYAQTDPLFKPSLFLTASEGKITDEIKTLEKYPKPVAVIFGAQDKMINIHYMDNCQIFFWRKAPVLIEGAGHWVHLDNPARATQLLRQYLQDIL